MTGVGEQVREAAKSFGNVSQALSSQQAHQWLQAGDIESAINAAGQIGDDHLQQQHSGVVRPETFTHDNSTQHQQERHPKEMSTIASKTKIKPKQKVRR